MDQQPAPNNPYPARQLRRDIYYQAVEILRSMLPGPLTDTPEAWARRDRVAIAKVAAMVPANPAEGELAAHHVALMAQAADALRQVLQHADDVQRAAQVRAQAASAGLPGGSAARAGGAAEAGGDRRRPRKRRADGAFHVRWHDRGAGQHAACAGSGSGGPRGAA